MYVRERILTIRLLEKVEKHPDYARKLGIEKGNPLRSSDSAKAEPKRVCK